MNTVSRQRPSLKTRLKNTAKNLLAVLFGIGAAFLIAEIALSFFFPPPPKFRYPQPRHQPDTELGWVIVPGQQNFTIDQDVSINSMGFRSPEVSAEKPDGAVRVLSLGDSQTFGNGVAQTEVYPAKLQEILSREPGFESVEVINAGVQAYNTIQEVRTLQRHATVLHPDIVTLAFYINDISESRSRERGPALGARGELKRRGLKRFTPYRLIYFVKRSRVVILVRDRFRRARASDDYAEIFAGRTPPDLEPAWELIEEHLALARDLAATRGFRLIVFPIPMSMEFRQDYPNEAYRSRFLGIADRLGIEHFDPTPELREGGATVEDNFIAWDGHINAATHRLIAERLARKILAADERKPVSKTASR